MTSAPDGLVGWRSTVTLVLITASILGFVTAITMVAPLLVDLSRELDVPLGQAGLLAAAMSLPWALGAPFTGLLSDRLGRRPLIVLALAGVGASTIAAGFASSFATLLLARFVAGMFGAFGPASVMAAVGDLFPPRRRGMAMGWLNAGFGLAAVAGVPMVGLIGGLWGWRWAFGLTGVVVLLLAVLVHLAFPSPGPSQTGSSLRQTYSEVLRVPLLGNVLAANLLERSIFNATLLYLPSFLMLSYGLATADVAPALALVAIGTLIGNSFGGWLGDRFLGPRATIFVCRPTGGRWRRPGAVRRGAGTGDLGRARRGLRHGQRQQPTLVSGTGRGAVTPLSRSAARRAVVDESGRHGGGLVAGRTGDRLWRVWHAGGADDVRWARCCCTGAATDTPQSRARSLTHSLEVRPTDQLVAWIAVGRVPRSRRP